MDPLRWIHCGGFVVVDSLWWIHCGGFIVVDSLWWIHCGGSIVVGVVVPPLWSLQRDASTVLLSPEATFIVLNKEMYFSESNSEIGTPGGGGDCLQVKPMNDQLLCVVYARCLVQTAWHMVLCFQMPWLGTSTCSSTILTMQVWLR